MGWGTVMLQLLFISVLETALTEVQEYSNIQLQMPRNHVLIIAQVIKKFRGNPALLCRRNLRKPNLGMANKTDWILRPAARDDAPSIFWLIQLLAKYLGKDASTLKVQEADILRDGFGESPHFHVIIAELTTTVDDSTPVIIEDHDSHKVQHNSRVIGHAVYYFTFSARTGRSLYLDDLFVREEYRSRGIGSALMQECAKIALANECSRMQWQVPDTNTRARSMYERVGGTVVRDLVTYHLHQPSLGQLADRNHGAVE